MRKAVFLLVFLITIPVIRVFSQSQGMLSRRFLGNWSVSVSGGPNIFFGDLKVYNFYPVSTRENEWRFAGTLSLNKQLSHVFMLRFQALYGEISGTKRYTKADQPYNRYFEGNILEYNLNTTINFTNLFSHYQSKRRFFIYGTVGFGLSTWNSKKKDLNTHEQVFESDIPSGWNNGWVVPAGLGAYYSIADKVNLGLEWTLRGIYSDNMDVTPGGYPYDMYSYLAMSVTYNFNQRRSPTLTYPHPQMQLGPVPVPQKTASEVIKSDTSDQSENVSADRLEAEIEETSMVMQEETITDTTDNFEERWTELMQKIEQSDTTKPDLVYHIQILALKSGVQTASQIQTKFKLNQLVTKEVSDGWNRFLTGSFKTEHEAKSMLNELRTKNGIRDAFIVRYENGKRTSYIPSKQ